MYYSTGASGLYAFKKYYELYNIVIIHIFEISMEYDDVVVVVVVRGV